MKRAGQILFFLIFSIGTIYLVLPAPKDFPPLPSSVKSTEPGDTVQIANVSAYYTDTLRKEVVDFYQDYFSRSPFLDIPLITYKLNHPPERIKEILRETQQTTYVEEFVHPFRESLFVSGFEWDNDPFTRPERRVKNILIVDGKVYQFKVTLFYQESKVWQRLLIFYLTLGVTYLLYRAYWELFQRWQKVK
ncbi:MAG TPA: hypothetical protein VMW04_01730 [Patescibacteria group bacterium]|nr:hypothetical protein [Patescibacteria group bacterium]